MTAYKLSIIIPVYNVERYLDECVNSILSQEQQGCQIILVDDGSTDGSGKICDKYAAMPHFVVIHKENGGSSSARNMGLQAASGDYIAFLDSDDRYACGSLSKVMEWIDTHDADICFMDGYSFYADGSERPFGANIEPDMVRNRSKIEVFEHLATRPKFQGSACTTIFKASFLKQNSLTFYEDKIYCEDLFFMLDCYMAAEKFDALKFPYYEYRKDREGAKTHVANFRTFWGMAAFVEYAVKKTSEDKIPHDRACECALSFAAYEYSIMLWQYSRLEGNEKPRGKAFLDEYAWVMKYGRSKKIKAIQSISGVLGRTITSKILDMYMTHR